MLNFRKLKQDFSSQVIKEGKQIYDEKKVIAAKILKLDSDTIRFSANVLGKYDNAYESEIEIDRFESQVIHSNCDCSYQYDCQHLVALIFYLEENIDSILVDYSKSVDIEEEYDDDEEQQEILDAFEEAKSKEEEKKEQLFQEEILQEYTSSSKILGTAPFFLPQEKKDVVQAELAVIFNPQSLMKKTKEVEFQLALRLSIRSKPLHIPYIKKFLKAVRYSEPIFFGSKKYLFSEDSFDQREQKVLKTIMDHARFADKTTGEKAQRVASIDKETFGLLLAERFESISEEKSPKGFVQFCDENPVMPCLYFGGLETPLRFSYGHAQLRFKIEYIEPPAEKILLNPTIVVNSEVLSLEDVCLFECSNPGMIYQEIYYRFPEQIRREHLLHLIPIRNMTIPKPLFGTFVENALPELKRFAEIGNDQVIDKFVTMPCVDAIKGSCDLSYLDGELEASLSFSYQDHKVPAVPEGLSFTDIKTFETEEGIVARNLVEEKNIIDDLFQDFVYHPQHKAFITKSEKKIVEFMTEVIPRNQDKVEFVCPQNLLDHFVYDDTEFTLRLDYTGNVGYYEIDLSVKGPLEGIEMDLLWDCIASKRPFIEFEKKKTKRLCKILVLDLEKISKMAQVFDELGISKLQKFKEQKPLWNLVSIDTPLFKDLPVNFTMSNKLRAIRKQMLGETEFKPSPISKNVKANLRNYQVDGIQWLERLRTMFLNGILADDMGLGKTVQAISALSLKIDQDPKALSLIVCPTSLLYNWKEELKKFNPKIKALVVDGIPGQRKKLLDKMNDYHVIITSYTLLQKDVELYIDTVFSYVILDEAQHIKNRGTRNAKSVKMIKGSHKLILTGTPIENSLNELWSLFDFLMPGFLSSYDRFMEKYIRPQGDKQIENIRYLKQKVSPFILRRMKQDVLDDLPPVDEITYHCQLTKAQKELYNSYAASARDELVKLVERDGFEKVQIHVLATLTRLKQICCHPAIFAKEKAESDDSAKYEMLKELLQSLIEGGHKTVIFSQYTKMLQIMREEFEKTGTRFSYLDGSSKNRLDIVNEFNQNPDIPIFLVSLKAGGTGLNLVGADTVIHYDLWWNPAVENQATDRVHRLGQKKSVSAYKLITKGTIEEKIVQMQMRKKGLVKKVISCDDEAIAKLTWEDVLELLQTDDVKEGTEEKKKKGTHERKRDTTALSKS